MEHSSREKPPQFGPFKTFAYHQGLLIPTLLLIGATALGLALQAPQHLIGWGTSLCLVMTGGLWCLSSIRRPRSTLDWPRAGVGITFACLGLVIRLPALAEHASLIGGVVLGGSSLGLAIGLSRLPAWKPLERATRLLDALTMGGASGLVLLQTRAIDGAAYWAGITAVLGLSVLILMIIPNLPAIWRDPLRMFILSGIIAAAGGLLIPHVNALGLPLVLFAAVGAGWAALKFPHQSPTVKAIVHEPLVLAMLPFLAWGLGGLIAGVRLGMGGLIIGMVGLWLRIGLVLSSQRTLARQLHAAIGDEAQLRLLLAGNAHNIKHPLANIQSYLIYLKSQSQRPHEQAQLIIESTIPPLEENAAILMERIKEMLEIARHAVVPVQCRPVTMGMLYEALHAMVLREQRTSTPPLQATVRCDADDTLAVWTDITAVCWCVENLIRNAIQAQRDQPAAIVTVRLAASSTTRLVTIEDTGPGFPPAVLEAGFASNAENPDLGGGLGLLGVQATIRQLGATLGLANRTPPVSGAIATIQLPTKG